MSTDVAVATPTTDLTIRSDQTMFSEVQQTALRHMGVEDATEADLQVFFHQVKRTGLDPFARQIHMIGRWNKKWDPQTRQESWEIKFTIQTGIDGYRLIGRRAADQAKETISIDAPAWLHEDGSWRPAWSKGWGDPLAARVTLYRGGQPFTAVAMHDEYVQTKRDGGPTQMWAQRPAGQLAKCAEALAWRMAFPQDLAGIYTHEEMAQADNAPDSPSRAPTAAAQPAAEERPAQPQHDPEQLLRDAWDSIDRLDKLGRWATQAGWPADYIARVRARWTELQTPTPEAAPEPPTDQNTTTEPIEGVIEDEPEN